MRATTIAAPLVLSLALLCAGCAPQGADPELCRTAEAVWHTYAVGGGSQDSSREEAVAARAVFEPAWAELSGADDDQAHRVDILEHISRSFTSAWNAGSESGRIAHTRSLRNGFDILANECAEARYDPQFEVSGVRFGLSDHSASLGQ